MIITATSDLHGNFPELPGGDLLLLGGDLTDLGMHEVDSGYPFHKLRAEHQWKNMIEWLHAVSKQYGQVFAICGNHELNVPIGFFDTLGISNLSDLNSKLLTLDGVSFYGEPTTFWYNAPGMAKNWEYTSIDKELDLSIWENVPYVDVVLSHGPAYGILDTVPSGEKIGSFGLLKYIEKKQPRYVIHGHNHLGKFLHETIGNTQVLNIAQQVINFEL